MMTDVINEKNAGSWKDYWTNIRNMNFMLARTHQVVGDATQINHYIGIARFFRAYLYYNLVKRYSDVPWYNRDLSDVDTELLYKKQDPRSLVVDNIMEDLQFAVDNIMVSNSRTRLTKYSALALQSRIALHEGTFRKYHPELELTDADKFLTLAAKAANEIIKAKVFSLHANYSELFNNTDLSSNKEMILFIDYDKALRKNNAHSAFDWTTGLSRDLMEDYLAIVKGKAVPFQTLSGYGTKALLEVFQDSRDAQLKYTFMNPGYIDAGKTSVYRPVLSRGGYPQIKFRPTTFDQLSWDNSYIDLPFFRYAEILLNYVEARAELGELTSDDLNTTINQLCNRVESPEASLADWLNNIDPVQENRYKNVNSSPKGAVLEIRRERRIELAWEGFRLNDIKRWGVGKILEKAPEGCYIEALGYQDITGDGEPDVAIVATAADADVIPQDDKDRYQLTVYVLENTSFGLIQGNKGYCSKIASR